MTSQSAWIRATEAAATLGVSRATLYAYVSRGFVRSQSIPGPSRERGYSRDDVERLRRRSETRRDPEKAATGVLEWGLPILESSITLIDGHMPYYRGHDAATLARSRSVQDVASLIWTGGFEAAFAIGVRPVSTSARSLGDDLPFVARAQAMLAMTAARDPLAYDVRPDAVVRRGWMILHLLTSVATGSSQAAPTLDQTLARAWRVKGAGVDVLRSALILCADHELNVSSFTARAVASAGSNPYAVVIAGLSALEGTKHGGVSARVEAMLDALRQARSLEHAVQARLRRGEPIDGFGHPLYPQGDPRARLLLNMLSEAYPRSGERGFTLAVATAAGTVLDAKPNIDFALAAVARVLQLPSGAPLMLFAIGRTIGWIGHAIEQYATGQLIRPRAKYVGVVPASIS